MSDVAEVLTDSLKGMLGLVTATARIHGNLAYAECLRDVIAILDRNGFVTREDLLALREARKEVAS